MGEQGQVFGGSPQAQVQMDEEHMEKRVKVALGLGTVVALCWPDHKEPIHGYSIGHVDMPIAVKQTLMLQKKRKKMSIHVNDSCEDHMQAHKTPVPKTTASIKSNGHSPMDNK